MREWVHGEDEPGGATKENSKQGTKNNGVGSGEKVIVVHCKAGKGRSGSMAVSYLISSEAWNKKDALQRFTERRMRPGFGPGVSIPSQLRWISYVERWTEHGKAYVERAVRVREVHIWGLREGVKVAIEGFVEEGRKIKTFHVFKKDERDDVGRGTAEESKDGVREAEKEMRRRSTRDTDSEEGTRSNDKQPAKDETPALLSVVTEVMKSQRRSLSLRRGASKRSSSKTSREASRNRPSQIATNASPSDATSHNRDASPSPSTTPVSIKSNSSDKPQEIMTTNTIFRPSSPITLPTSDINISLERRARPSYGWAMVTSVAHVWFNTFFEGRGPERLAEHQQALERRGNNNDKLADDVPRGPEDSGVFEIKWEDMDGIKGSARKGARALDKLAVVWEFVPTVAPDVSPVPESRTVPFNATEDLSGTAGGDEGPNAETLEEERGRDSFSSAHSTLQQTISQPDGVLITEPTHAGDVREPHAAHWAGSPVRQAAEDEGSPMARRLGMREEHDDGLKRNVVSTIGEEDDGRGARGKSREEREERAGEEQPELDEGSDEDGTEGIRRGVSWSKDEAERLRV